jgi:hypothetical protein
MNLFAFLARPSVTRLGFRASFSALRGGIMPVFPLKTRKRDSLVFFVPANPAG